MKSSATQPAGTLPVDYRTDIKKHFIRSNVWLPACLGQKQATKRHFQKYPLRYFTFCAEEAIDVFMLARERVVVRSERTGRLEGVYFCEKDEVKFGRIASLIGAPEQGLLGDFADIVLFEDDQETIGKDLFAEDDPYYPQELRQKLANKDAQQRFRAAFPFDIINMDVYGLLFPRQNIGAAPRRDGVISRLLKAILRILDWQAGSPGPDGKPCQQFTLLLTTHIDPDITDPEAVSQLRASVDQNMATTPPFREAFNETYGTESTDAVATEKFPEFFCLGLAKYLIGKSLYDYGWAVEYDPIYLYNRDDAYVPGRQYQMMHAVAVFKRIENVVNLIHDPRMALYREAVVPVAAKQIPWVERSLGQDVATILSEDVEAIVRYRDRAS